MKSPRSRTIQKRGRMSARETAAVAKLPVSEGHGTCVMDEKGRVVSWNHIVEKLTGYRAKDIVGKNFALLYTKESRSRDELQKAIAHASRNKQYIGEGLRVRTRPRHLEPQVGKTFGPTIVPRSPLCPPPSSAPPTSWTPT